MVIAHKLIVALFALATSNFGQLILADQSVEGFIGVAPAVGPNSQPALPSGDVKASIQAKQDVPIPVHDGAMDDIGPLEILPIEQYKRTAYYVPLFDPLNPTLPMEHVVFLRSMVERDIKLYDDILKEAVRLRKGWFPGVKLVSKFAAKIIFNTVKNYREGLRLNPKFEPNPGFYKMMEISMKNVLRDSKFVQSEKGYTKSNIDIVQFQNRVEAIFKFIRRAALTSPVVSLVRWDEAVLFKGTPSEVLLLKEATDLVAQFRALGYSNAVGIANRVANMLGGFSKGVIPDENAEAAAVSAETS